MTMPGIEIRDQDSSGLLTTSLSDLVEVLDPKARAMTWAIWELEGVAKESSGRDMLSLEAQVRNGPVILTWEQVKKLASDLFDIWNAKIVGSRDISSGQDVARPEKEEIVIERFDSSYWTVHAAPEILDLLRTRFADLQDIAG